MCARTQNHEQQKQESGLLDWKESCYWGREKKPSKEQSPEDEWTDGQGHTHTHAHTQM